MLCASFRTNTNVPNPNDAYSRGHQSRLDPLRSVISHFIPKGLHLKWYSSGTKRGLEEIGVCQAPEG